MTGAEPVSQVASLAGLWPSRPEPEGSLSPWHLWLGREVLVCDSATGKYVEATVTREPRRATKGWKFVLTSEGLAQESGLGAKGLVPLRTTGSGDNQVHEWSTTYILAADGPEAAALRKAADEPEA